MNTYINLTYKGITYKLEYDRASIKLLEANGFNIDDFLKKPITNIELAFAGAFIKNHRNVKQTTIDSIYNSCPNKTDLVNKLREMIAESYNSLLEDPENSDEGNVVWEVIDLSPTKEKNE